MYQKLLTLYMVPYIIRISKMTNVNLGMKEELWYTVIAEFQEKLKKSRGRSKTFCGCIRRQRFIGRLIPDG